MWATMSTSGSLSLVNSLSNSTTTSQLEVPSFTNYKAMIGAKFKQTGHVTLTTPLLRAICNANAGT